MPLTIGDHLRDRNNRCLLIVVGLEKLDYDNICVTLLTYGVIKKIEFTPDYCCAFVDFDCEDAPLLALRCFQYHKTNASVPMPRGVDALFPGCSHGRFLYLQHVPRGVANCTLERYFSAMSIRVKNLYRPLIDDPQSSMTRPSSRVLIELSGSAAYFTKNTMKIHFVNEAGTPLQFYAIPNIDQLSNYKDIENVPGCSQCNVDEVRGLIEQEEERINAPPPSPSARDLSPIRIRTPTPPDDPALMSYVEEYTPWFEPPEGVPAERKVPAPPLVPTALPSLPLTPPPLPSPSPPSPPLPSPPPPSLPPFPPPHHDDAPVNCEKKREETINYRNQPHSQDRAQSSTQDRSGRHNDSFVFPFPISEDGYAPKLQCQKIFRRKDRGRITTCFGIERVQSQTVRPDSQSSMREMTTPTLSDLIEESDENGGDLSPSELPDYDNIPLMHYVPRIEESEEHPFSKIQFAKPLPRAPQSSASERHAPPSATASIGGAEKATGRRLVKEEKEVKVRQSPIPASLPPRSALQELIDQHRFEEKKVTSSERPVSRVSASEAPAAASKARDAPTPMDEKENAGSEAPRVSQSSMARRKLAKVLMGRGNGREERVICGEEEKKAEKEEKKTEKEEKKEKKAEKEEKKKEGREEKKKDDREEKKKDDKKVSPPPHLVPVSASRDLKDEKKVEIEEKEVAPLPPLVPSSAPLQEKRNEVKKEHPLARILFGKKKKRDTPSPSDLKDEEKEAQSSARATPTAEEAREEREAITPIEPKKEEKKEESKVHPASSFPVEDDYAPQVQEEGMKEEKSADERGSAEPTESVMAERMGEMEEQSADDVKENGETRGTDLIATLPSLAICPPDVPVDVIDDGRKSPFLPDLLDEKIPIKEADTVTPISGDFYSVPTAPSSAVSSSMQLLAAPVAVLQQQEEEPAPLPSSPPSDPQPLQQTPLDSAPAPATPKYSGKNLLSRGISTVPRTNADCGEDIGGYVKTVRDWSGPSEVESGDSKKGRREAVSRWLNEQPEMEGKGEEKDRSFSSDRGQVVGEDEENEEEEEKGREEEGGKKDDNDNEVRSDEKEEEEEGENAEEEGERVVSPTPITPSWLGRDAVDSDDESMRDIERDDIIDSSTPLPTDEITKSDEQAEQRDAVSPLILPDFMMVSKRWSDDEEEEKGKEKNKEEVTAAIRKKIWVISDDEDESEKKGEEEKEAEARQRDASPSVDHCSLEGRESEVGDEEGRAEKEEGEEKGKEAETQQRGTGPSFIALMRSPGEMDSDDEEEEEERLEMEEKEEEETVTEEEQRAVYSSSTLSSRWTRTTTVDEEEDGDYRSSEYQRWLTREDGTEAFGRVSPGNSSPGEEAEVVPLPSTLSTTSWGRGIEIEEETTVPNG